jgi:thiamine biosynthesis protein ThiS
MKITLNRQEEEIPGGQMTIRDILKYKNFSFPNLVVRINGKLVKKPDYDTAMVVEGDFVEIIHLISGG